MTKKHETAIPGSEAVETMKVTASGFPEIPFKDQVTIFKVLRSGGRSMLALRDEAIKTSGNPSKTAEQWQMELTGNLLCYGIKSAQTLFAEEEEDETFGHQYLIFHKDAGEVIYEELEKIFGKSIEPKKMMLGGTPYCIIDLEE